MAGAVVAIRVQPRARSTEVAGERAGVPRSAVTIVRGEAARDKLVRVEGVEEAQLRAALLA